MRFLIFFVILFGFKSGLSQNDSLCKEEFYNKALGDSSSMNLIKVRFLDSNGEINNGITFNIALYHFFKRHKGFTFSEYFSFIRDVIAQKRTMDFSSLEFPGPILKNDKYVQKIADGGKKELIDHFFKRGSFQFQYIQYFENVSVKLFDYGVLVTMEGGLKIVYESPCEKLFDNNE